MATSKTIAKFSLKNDTRMRMRLASEQQDTCLGMRRASEEREGVHEQ